MPAQVNYSECSTQARDRGISYGFLAWLFLEHPDREFLERMLSAEPASWALSVGEGEVSPSILAGLEAMRASLSSRPGQSTEGLCRELAVQRTRLFRGVAPGYGPPPPYETLYRDPEGAGEAEVMLQLRRFYREAGAQLPPDQGERLDYLGLELDLMRLLCEEESLLWGEDDRQGVARARGIQEELLTRHLLAWAPRFCQVILKEPGVPFYHGVAALLSAFLKEEATLFITTDKPRRHGEHGDSSNCQAQCPPCLRGEFLRFEQS